MAELWQSYGSWIFYGVAFVVMLLLHGRMHGGHAHGATGEHDGRHAVEAGPVAGDPQVTQTGSAAGHSHGEPGKSPKRGHRGCC
ncbi:MAG: hypothetical protein QME77_06110 [bacterium]|nr:hypothetical protein [bacterium]